MELVTALENQEVDRYTTVVRWHIFTKDLRALPIASGKRFREFVKSSLHLLNMKLNMNLQLPELPLEQCEPNVANKETWK